MSALKTQCPFQKSRSFEICIVLNGDVWVLGRLTFFRESSAPTVLARSANILLVKHQWYETQRVTYRARHRH